ncbi:unnamed protein product [Urochloa decumbens]|uniref:F-box domain-containing protein n=1 Tax=Urochloa decumbens TaxID=240449 RepID=A0ABC9BX59_9POAL
MEDDYEAADKLRGLDHHRGLGDMLRPSTTTASSSSFHTEDLVEDIQTIILSLLPLKEAARTSLVSRSWRMDWRQHPNLCFDATKPRSKDKDCVKRAKFIETVNSVIQQHSGRGLNEFRIKCGLREESSDHIDGWIRFATAAKAKIIGINLWSSRKHKYTGVFGWSRWSLYRFPLDALGAPDGPFIQSLFLSDVSIEPHLDTCGLTKLKRLVLHSVQIVGDIADLLLNCSSLEDLKLIACSGNVIPIVLHGCSKLEKASVKFKQDDEALDHTFTAIPSISGVKELNMRADMNAYVYYGDWVSQVHTATRPTHMFLNLRLLTCEIRTCTRVPNSHSGLLQLAHCLNSAPQLETLQLHMLYAYVPTHRCDVCWTGEVTGEGASCMGRLGSLRTVHMSGFRCYRAQVELLCGILEKSSSALERVTLETEVTLRCPRKFNTLIPGFQIRQWARATSKRFGKVITVVSPCSPIPKILGKSSKQYYKGGV